MLSEAEMNYSSLDSILVAFFTSESSIYIDSSRSSHGKAILEIENKESLLSNSICRR